MRGNEPRPGRPGAAQRSGDHVERPGRHVTMTQGRIGNCQRFVGRERSKAICQGPLSRRHDLRHVVRLDRGPVRDDQPPRRPLDIAVARHRHIRLRWNRLHLPSPEKRSADVRDDPAHCVRRPSCVVDRRQRVATARVPNDVACSDTSGQGTAFGQSGQCLVRRHTAETMERVNRVHRTIVAPGAVIRMRRSTGATPSGQTSSMRPAIRPIGAFCPFFCCSLVPTPRAPRDGPGSPRR